MRRSKNNGDIGVKIVGTGSYLPEKILTNRELEQMVDTTDEWIRTRTGIEKRHIAAESEPTSALGAAASLRALEAAGLEAGEIDLIIVATISPDKIFPNTGCFIQKRIGADRAACFSVEAACSGFVYIFAIGTAMIQTGIFRNALLIGAEKLSSIINWRDRSTCVLFGDGAGAVVLQACGAEEDTHICSKLGSDGNYTDILHIPGGGSHLPMSQTVLDENLQYLAMSGQEVFKLAVNTMVSAATDTLERSGLTIDEIRWLIPHQANTRIITSVARRLGLPEEKAFMNLSKYGNTSGATIPIALDEIVRGGLVSRGDYLLFVAFGGGLTWGANLIRW
jgi:3-oxoacyl-[acyl-carrier-protein] synthase III